MIQWDFHTTVTAAAFSAKVYKMNLQNIKTPFKILHSFKALQQYERNYIKMYLLLCVMLRRSSSPFHY